MWGDIPAARQYNSPRPIAVNSYCREYFVCFRIVFSTFDHECQFLISKSISYLNIHRRDTPACRQAGRPQRRRFLCWPKAKELMENRHLPRTLRGIFDRFSINEFSSVSSVSRTSPLFLIFRYALCSMRFAIIHGDEWVVKCNVFHAPSSRISPLLFHPRNLKTLRRM